jgi:hypothetical protein
MADLYSNIASGVGSLFGASSDTTNVLQGVAGLAGGAYDLYRGIQAQGQYDDYMSQLYASQALSDQLLREQAARAEELYYPIEDLEAQYALEDMQRMRGLQTAQQDYSIGKGLTDIAYAQGVVDPTRYGLISQLAEGAAAQKYMDQASADITQAFSGALDDTSRAYSRMGINPNSGAMKNLITQSSLAQAAAQAGARTESARMAEDLDLQRRQQAVNLWAGIPMDTQQVSQSGAALASQAAGGLQSAASGLSTGAQLAGQEATSGFSGASAAFGSVADAFGNVGGSTGSGLGTYVINPGTANYR